MLRFVIRRKILDRNSGLQSEQLETVDCECAELERVLCGGFARQAEYDHREVAGVEVLIDERSYTEHEISMGCIAAGISDGRSEALLLHLKPGEGER